MTYLLVNVFSIAIPLGFSFHHRLRFWQQWRAWLPAIILPAIPFLLWDVYFTQLGVWGFNPEHLLDLSLLGLPLEEWFFFFAIPYACLFTYHSLKVLVPVPFSPFVSGRISLVLAFILLLLRVIHIERLYTGITFLLTGASLLIYLWKTRGRYPEYFYLAYLIIFAIPFLLVNGVLTGLGLEQPVVWYNNSENLAIRVFTIPVEDFIYGFLLFFMNVVIYEKQLSKRNEK
jgi:lycopene cyclase domain-containing protein